MRVELPRVRLPRSTEGASMLLGAVLDVGRDLELSEVLARIVRSACAMVGAHYGALGVLRPDREGLMEFITDGLTAEQEAAAGPPPIGTGLLGLLIADPRPIRIGNLGDHPASSGMPPGHPPMTSFLGAPIRVRGEVFGNLYLTDKVGGLEFTEEDENLVVALAAAAALAIDNALMFQTTHRQKQWADALGEMSRELLSGRDPRVALGLLVERAAGAAEAQFAAVALASEGQGLVVEAATGIDPRARSIVGTPLTEAHWQAVLELGEPLMLLSREGESAAEVSAAVLREAVGLPVHGRTAIVPMTIGGGSVGLLVVGWVEGESHLAYDVADPLKQYADQAAVTLTAASAQRDRARMVVLEDRERIARDMHDVVIQRLFATGLGLQSAYRVATQPFVQTHLADAVDELDLAIKDIRRMIFALHQPEQTSLVGEVGELVESFAEPLGHQPRLQVEGPLDDLPDMQVRLDLLAVVREALSNVARHAQAHAVEVQVRVSGESVRVAVEDDGVGVGETGRSSGLANLHERAARHGGMLVLTSPVGDLGGTRLVWEIPCAVEVGEPVEATRAQSA